MVGRSARVVGKWMGGEGVKSVEGGGGRHS